ncbi:MAG: phosphatase PAP2 family protein [Candidatus Woesearchaeota archaeon]
MFLDKTVIKFISLIYSPTIEHLFIIITTLGNAYVFASIIIILTIALIVYKRPVTSFILSVAAAVSIQWLLKIIIQRPRPFEVGLTNPNTNTVVSSSFPSGHTIIFFAIIPLIGKSFPKIRPILWATAILVGFSRIYLGVHYISDVLAGALFGYFIGWTLMKLEERYLQDNIRRSNLS